MKTLLIVASLISQLLFAAAPEYTDLDYGPLPENCREVVTQHFINQTQNPSISVHIEATQRTPYAQVNGAITTYRPAWAVMTTVNATNKDGTTSDYYFVVYLHGQEVIGQMRAFAKQ